MRRMKTPSGEEFEARQMCLPIFGRAARIVLPIIVKMRKALRAWEKPARTARALIQQMTLDLTLTFEGKTRAIPG